MRTRISLSLLTAIVIVFAGCADSAPNMADTSDTIQQSRAVSVVPADVAAAVVEYIQDIWPSAQVTVEADETGRITLEGTVSSEQEKEDIDNEVSLLPGVDRLRNRLKVAGE